MNRIIPMNIEENETDEIASKKKTVRFDFDSTNELSSKARMKTFKK